MAFFFKQRTLLCTTAHLRAFYSCLCHSQTYRFGWTDITVISIWSFSLPLSSRIACFCLSLWYEERISFYSFTKSLLKRCMFFLLPRGSCALYTHTHTAAHSHRKKDAAHTRSHVYKQTHKGAFYLAVALTGLFMEYGITESPASLSLPADWTLSTLSVKHWP